MPSLPNPIGFESSPKSGCPILAQQGWEGTNLNDRPHSHHTSIKEAPKRIVILSERGPERTRGPEEHLLFGVGSGVVNEESAFHSPTSCVPMQRNLATKH